MATINTVAYGQRPGSVVLPESERMLFSCSGCNVSITSQPSALTWTARGTCMVTSQRLLFVARVPTTSEMKSLSVPLHSLSNGRYTMPILWAPYWQATMLLEHVGHRRFTHLQLQFHEGGGAQFHSMLTKAQQQWDIDRRYDECLPPYAPPGIDALVPPPPTYDETHT
ncbi:hypothetical protein Malapachy_3518 [Malassezia pachydermatis]|uniref:Uncharacterized protein n=1 Tax=Malassezia pachydermatis TaxID=77020 RepID=A0A0M9VQY7_9BASI|nr:hypothetical protein Malapachy_3518 [Malassezia pachydermatis]KOS16065.1 hypothetical protein Malapachy_3518 [Malassezia pachydermatis]